MNQPNCTICTSASSFLLKKDGYDLYKCPTCGLVFVHPQPEGNFLKEKVYSYESGYQSNKKGNFGDVPKDKKTRKIFEMLAALNKQGNLLDVGCSSGEFMHYAELEGFDAYGVELNRRTVEVARNHGLNVFNGYLEDAKYENEFFDVIFLGDIIEHVPSPHALLKECARVLKSGGVMVISTPNLDCLWSESTFLLYKFFGIPWSSVTPPYHLYQFSVGNLYRLMRVYKFLPLKSFYLRPPRLMYELGSLHLLKQYKNNKTVKNFADMCFSFAVYTLFYGIDFLITPLKMKDFSMVITYVKE
jgi:SAM-dependent methyltransferase